MYSNNAYAIRKFIDTRRDVDVDKLKQATITNLVENGKERRYVISLEFGEIVEGLVQRAEKEVEDRTVYRGKILDLLTI